MNFPTVMVTGHRVLSDEQRTYATDALRKIAKTLLKNHNTQEVISGMALGADTIWAETALEFGIPLAAYIPFPQQADTWTPNEQKTWQELRDQSSREVCIAQNYSVRYLHARNDRMLKDSSLVIAVWEPSLKTGGTTSTVNKARALGKPIIIVDIENFTLTTEKPSKSR